MKGAARFLSLAFLVACCAVAYAELIVLIEGAPGNESTVTAISSTDKAVMNVNAVLVE